MLAWRLSTASPAPLECFCTAVSHFDVETWRRTLFFITLVCFFMTDAFGSKTPPLCEVGRLSDSLRNTVVVFSSHSSFWCCAFFFWSYMRSIEMRQVWTHWLHMQAYIWALVMTRNYAAQCRVYEVQVVLFREQLRFNFPGEFGLRASIRRFFLSLNIYMHVSGHEIMLVW